MERLARARYALGAYDALLAQTAPEGRWALAGEREDARRFWRAMGRYGRGECAEAVAELDGFEAAWPQSALVARVWRLRAWCRLAQGDVEGALAAFAAGDAAASPGPERDENLLQWGRTLLENGRAAEAVAVLERLTAAEGAETEAVRVGRYWLGLARLRAGGARAQADLEASGADEQLPPDLRAAAWFAAAELAGAGTNTTAAARAWEAGLALAQGEARLNGGFNYGRWLLEQDRPVEAEPWLLAYTAAHPERPESTRAHLALARAFLAAGEAQRAVERYQGLREVSGEPADQAEAAEGLGAALRAVGRDGEAAAAFLRAGELRTNSAARARCFFQGGDAYLANAQYASARDAYARAVAEADGSELQWRARFQMAQAMAADGDLDGAEIELRRIAADPGAREGRREAWLQVAALRERREDWNGAVQAYDDMLQSVGGGPGLAPALYGRGTAEFRLFRFGRALEAFDRILAEAPEAAEAEGAAFRRALCLFWMGRDDEALQACRDFLAARPQSKLAPEARYWMARQYYNGGDFAEAQRAFATYARDYPADERADDALLWAGRAAARRREYVQAVDILAQLVKRYPESARLPNARQADALTELANYAAAILIFDEIINKYGGSELVPLAWGRKGDCQFMLGGEDPRRYEESMASYRVVANDASAAEDLVLQAEYKIGRCLEKMGRADEALDQYYARVMTRFLRDQEKGRWHNENAKLWFARAAFNAADLMEAREDWRGAGRILARVVQAGVPAAKEAEERLERLRREHWWML